ncbi:hypothetical protein K458DRAFT_382389 [Lentithecium fluviatile CBS 122367]|uniref:Uncharacterized protein n=1 Tax=Lentithecium fluviatile CBS 122367 TaxID=1168545 RepID=A0A6G1JK02_9PLEO|nr:hypothetical protein K458DRAFT_382389 [Lentithecium fluviatile CBS 122367]
MIPDGHLVESSRGVLGSLPLPRSLPGDRCGCSRANERTRSVRQPEIPRLGWLRAVGGDATKIFARLSVMRLRAAAAESLARWPTAGGRVLGAFQLPAGLSTLSSLFSFLSPCAGARGVYDAMPHGYPRLGTSIWQERSPVGAAEIWTYSP